MLDAQSNVALIIHARRIRELVRLEVYPGLRFVLVIGELSHYLAVDRTTANRQAERSHCERKKSEWRLTSFSVTISVFVTKILSKVPSISQDDLPFVIYEPLLAPPKAVAYQAIGDLQTKQLLFVDANDQGQGIADLHILRHVMLGWITAEDLHRASRHWCGCLRTIRNFNISWIIHFFTSNIFNTCLSEN